jgi:hypothetical protein
MTLNDIIAFGIVCAVVIAIAFLIIVLEKLNNYRNNKTFNLVINEPILKNAPEGATHFDCAQYYKYTDRGDWFCWLRNEWTIANYDEFRSVCYLRLLSDIKEIAELKAGYEELRVASLNAIHSMHGQSKADLRDAYDKANDQLYYKSILR